MKKISVIVPCHNSERTIDRCIRSIVQQTIGMNAIELILVNDCSSDNTLNKLLRWEKRFQDSITVIDCKENGKTGGARNVGIRQSSGEFIAFVDDDDWIDPSMYEKMYHAMSKYSCDVVAVLYDREEESGMHYNMEMPSGKTDILVNKSNKPSDAAELPGEIWNKLYRRDLIINNDLFFAEKLSYTENYWYPLLQYYIQSYYVVGERLYHYMVNSNSIICRKDIQSCMDRLEIERLFLNEIKERNLDNIYSESIEYNFVKKFYLNTLHLLFYSENRDLSTIFLKMKKEVLERYPQYYNNRLIQKECYENEMYFIFRTLEVDMPDELWYLLAEKYRKNDWDISIYETYIDDASFNSPLDPRGIFKKKYYSIRALRQYLQGIYDGICTSEWYEIKQKIIAYIDEYIKLDVFITDSGIRKKCEKILNLDIVQEYINDIELSENSKNAIDGLKALHTFLELPELLAKLVWGRGAFIEDQFIPALEWSYQQVNEEIIDQARTIVNLRQNPIFSFSYLYDKYSFTYAWDKKEQMYFFILNGRNMYLPYKYYSTPEQVEHYVRGLFIEQDERSAHRYLNERMSVAEGDIVLDAGVAEGNFAAMVIDKVKRIYLVECDEEYIRALKVTFRDCLDKIVLIPKFLGKSNDDTHITIDEIMAGGQLNYLKMDIEGSELDALEGAEYTLSNSNVIKCNICVYHRLHHNEIISKKMEDFGFEVKNSSGWMSFPFDPEFPHYPRRGLVQAVKRI